MERIPQYLSSPYQALWFEADEIVIIAVAYIIVSTIGKLFAFNLHGLFSWGLLIGMPYGYIVLKKTKPRGFLMHCLYFIGVKTFKNYPDFFTDHFHE
jgi:hypothetical protein